MTHQAEQVIKRGSHFGKTFNSAVWTKKRAHKVNPRNGDDIIIHIQKCLMEPPLHLSLNRSDEDRLNQSTCPSGKNFLKGQPIKSFESRGTPGQTGQMPDLTELFVNM